MRDEELHKRVRDLERIVERLVRPYLCRYTILADVDVVGGKVSVTCCEICSRVK